MNEGLKEICRDHREGIELYRGRLNWQLERDKGHYSDPGHFIYELMQNAEDVNASTIHFELEEGLLICEHNGKPFSLEDVKAITSPGLSTKKADPNSIGKFGMGFDSVFNITDTPIVTSGNYAFKIIDDYLPEPIDRVDYSEITRFEFPLAGADGDRQKVYESILKGLKDLNADKILFLNNISSITWSANELSNRLCINDRPFNETDQIRRITIEDSFSGDLPVEFLIVSKTTQIVDESTIISIGFKVDNISGDLIFVKEKEAKVYTYFPTERNTGLFFKIQAPFHTTPNRENIKQGVEVNDLLLDEIGNLLAKCLDLFKSNGLLSLSFLSILPYDPELSEDYIYNILSKRIVSAITEGVYIPTHDKSYSGIDDIAIAKERYLPTLFTTDDLQLLFGVGHWADIDIRSNSMKEFRRFLVNTCDVHEKSFSDFMKSLQIENVEDKSDKWFVSLYNYLSNVPGLWRYDLSPVKKKPIIRLESGETIAPFNEQGVLNAYLPTDSVSSFNTVAEPIIEDDKSVKFLQELGLKTPDIFAELNEFVIQKYQTGYNPSDAEYTSHLALIIKSYRKDPTNKLFKRLTDVPFIRVYDLLTGELTMASPCECYFENEDIKRYFEHCEDVYVIDKEIFGEYDINVIDEFLASVGVEEIPRVLEIEAELTYEKRQLYRGGQKSTRIDEEKVIDKIIHGLDTALQSMTFEKSKILWSYIIEKSNRHYNDYLFQGTYTWFYQKERRKHFESSLFKLLTSSDWLYTKDGEAVSPQTTSVGKLDDFYTKNEEGYKLAIRLQVVGDKYLQEQSLDGSVHVSMTYEEYKEFQDFNRSKIEQQLKISGKNSEKETEWIPLIVDDHDISGIPLIKSNPSQVMRDIPLATNAGSPSNNENVQYSDDLIREIEMDNLTGKDSNKEVVGRLGEEFVYKKLQEIYADQKASVIWHNETSDKGVGFDITIQETDEEGDTFITKYVEVKSTLNPKSEIFNVTARQWHTLKELYHSGKGDLYSIIVVTNLRSGPPAMVSIENPYKLWIEGRLYAQPIGIKLPPDL